MISYVNKTYIKLDFVELRTVLTKGREIMALGMLPAHDACLK